MKRRLYMVHFFPLAFKEMVDWWIWIDKSGFCFWKEMMDRDKGNVVVFISFGGRGGGRGEQFRDTMGWF